MDLKGGLDMYNGMKRYMNGSSPHGRHVVYLAENGWNYDVECANKYFIKGQVLTVDEIFVGGSSSNVSFIGFEGMTFNTVMFEDIE